MFEIILLVALILAILVAVGFLVTWIYSIKKTNAIQKNIIENSRYEINTRLTEYKAADLLNSFIEDCFIDYQLMILIPKREMYISDEREQEILSDLAAKVAERISPNLIERLSQFYNPNSIDKIIADKISIAVSNYIINNNLPRDITNE